MMAAKQSEIAAFMAENRRWLPENYQSNKLEVQARQSAIANLSQQISQERQSQAVLESNLNNKKNMQASLYENRSPAARQLETSVTVAADGKISLAGRGDFAVAGLTPAQLAAALGANSSVRIEHSASQMVTVLVPLLTRDRFHVSAQFATGRKFVQAFETDAASQPALAKAVPLRAGSYHLVVVVRNLASGVSQRSALDFNME